MSKVEPKIYFFFELSTKYDIINIGKGDIMLEEALALFGLDEELIIDYEDLYNSYLELLEEELENQNIENIYKIITSYNLVYSYFYPEYKSNQNYEEIYQNKTIQLGRMLCITELIKKNLDMNNKNDKLIIKLLEQNVIKDHWARTQKIKKLN